MLSAGNDLSSMIALRAAQTNRLALNQALNRLATGRRIYRSSDNPAGLIASVGMDATLAALDAETSANQRAMNVANTADGALGQISDLLNDAKTLTAATANDAGLSTEEKQANQLEVDAILSSVNRIANTTSFAGQKLLNGNGLIAASGQSLTIDSARTTDIGKVEIDSTDYTLADLGSGKSLDTTGGSSNTEKAGDVLDTAINQVATIRGKLGAFSRNTLEPRISQIASAQHHMLATVSIIRDADYAMESSAKTRAELMERSSLLLLKQSSQSRRGYFLSVLA